METPWLPTRCGTDPTEAQAILGRKPAGGLEAMVQALQEHNRTLQEQLQTSRISRPPRATATHDATPSSEQRRRGGQPGTGHTRTLIPVER